MITIAPDIEQKRSFVANVTEEGPKPMRWSLPRKVIEVYYFPVVDEESKTGYSYDQQEDYTLSDSISLQSYPDKKITVADLFR